MAQGSSLNKRLGVCLFNSLFFLYWLFFDIFDGTRLHRLRIRQYFGIFLTIPYFGRHMLFLNDFFLLFQLLLDRFKGLRQDVLDLFLNADFVGKGFRLRTRVGSPVFRALLVL